MRIYSWARRLCALLGTLAYNYPPPNLARIAKEHGFSYELVTFHIGGIQLYEAAKT